MRPLAILLLALLPTLAPVGGLLHLLPALALLGLLAAGRYPGAGRLARSARPRPARAGAPAPAPGRGPAALLPRGGRLMGRALAVRPPPVASFPA